MFITLINCAGNTIVVAKFEILKISELPQQFWIQKTTAVLLLLLVVVVAVAVAVVVVVIVVVVVFCVQCVRVCKFTAVLGYFRRPHKKFDICISTWNHTFQILYCTGNWLPEGSGTAFDTLIAPQVVKNFPSVRKIRIYVRIRTGVSQTCIVSCWIQFTSNTIVLWNPFAPYFPLRGPRQWKFKIITYRVRNVKHTEVLQSKKKKKFKTIINLYNTWQEGIFVIVRQNMPTCILNNRGKKISWVM
jgi:hypothetical protein